MVVGAGSWGTALAIQFARGGHPTCLWGRDAGARERMHSQRCNADYLPGTAFPAALQVAASMETGLKGADHVVVAVPSEAFRHTLEQLRSAGFDPAGQITWATKGFELATGLLPHQVVAEVLGESVRAAVLSGPTFATEVAASLPSALTVAASEPDLAHEIAVSITTDTFRAYTSTDMVGVEIGGATKNVYAIGAGMSDGLGFGANTRIALVTRGLAEMTRLGRMLGARVETFMGLAGVGDLVLTCTDDLSRNRRFGKLLAAGASATDAQREIGQVVEGYIAARAVREVAARAGVEMPLIEQIHDVLYAAVDPREAVTRLMSRPIMAEAG